MGEMCKNTAQNDEAEDGEEDRKNWKSWELSRINIYSWQQ